METVVAGAAKITHIVHMNSIRGPVIGGDVGTHWKAETYAKSGYRVRN